MKVVPSEWAVGGDTQSASVNSVLEAGDSAARCRTGEFILEH